MCLFLHSKDSSFFSAAFVFSAHSREKREMSGATLRHMLDQTQLGLPKLTQIYGTAGNGRGDHRMSFKYQKAQKDFPRFFLKPRWWWGRTGEGREVLALCLVWSDWNPGQCESAGASTACPHLSLCRSAYRARWQSRGWWGPACPAAGLLSLGRCSSQGSPGPVRTSSAAAWSSSPAPPAVASLQDKFTLYQTRVPADQPKTPRVNKAVL